MSQRPRTRSCYIDNVNVNVNVTDSSDRRHIDCTILQFAVVNNSTIE